MSKPVRKYFVFQDESGEIDDTYFFSGATVIPELEMQKLQAIEDEVRSNKKFYDEFHFQKMSRKRYHAYKELLMKSLSELSFLHKTIVVSKHNCNLLYFGNQSHIAYNYYTRQVIYYLIKDLNGNIFIFPDDKNRIKKDNFIDYLDYQLNFDAFYHGLNYHVSLIEPHSSKNDIGLQLNDLLLGVIRQGFIPASGKYKTLLRQDVCCTLNYWVKCNIWRWRPKAKR